MGVHGGRADFAVAFEARVVTTSQPPLNLRLVIAGVDLVLVRDYAHHPPASTSSGADEPPLEEAPESVAARARNGINAARQSLAASSATLRARSFVRGKGKLTPNVGFYDPTFRSLGALL